MALALAIATALVAPASRATAQAVFASPQAANLPTAQTLPRSGNWLFEISHRFVPPVSAGSDELWGLDGPVYNRLGLSWAPTGSSLLTIQRSNLDDNLELSGRFVPVRAGTEDGIRVDVGVMAGVAWNTNPVDPGGGERAEDNESQFYAQAIVDARFTEWLAFGVVPTYLRNPRILDPEPDNGFAVGVHGLAHLGGAFSLLGEWIFSEERPGMEYDSGTFGIEIRTRGHFFKLVVTNQPRMNSTQFLAGSPYPFESDELRLGFNITRLLPF